MKNKNKLQNKWSVFKENNPSAHIFLTIIGINILFILCSSFLLMFLPENAGRSFPEMLRFAFTLMVNPSGRYIYSDYPISLIITTIVVLLGMISLTGGTVGYITSVINTILEKSAQSKSCVKLKDHIVILNYNNRVPALVQDYCYDDMDSTYITILSSVDKDTVTKDIEAVYAKKQIGKRFKNIIIREGNPLSKADLDNISLKDARTVMIMAPEAVGEDAVQDNNMFEVAKLFMYVSLYFAENHGKNKTNIVVEANNPDMEEMIRNYTVDDLYQISVPVNYTDIIGKTLAVTTMMPGMYEVLQILFSFEGVELYTREIPKDKTILDELRTSRSALPLFDMGDKRVYVAENEGEIGRSISAAASGRRAFEKIISPTMTFEKNSILIIGTSRKLPCILESLVCFSRDYEIPIRVFLADKEENLPVLKAFYENPAYAPVLIHSVPDPIVIRDLYHPLNDIGEDIFRSVQSVLFLSDDCVSENKLDEAPLLYWCGLKNASREIPHQDLVVEVLSAQNHKIIERKFKDQTVVSDSFLGHFYAQLGKNPTRLDIMKDLLTAEGDSSAVNSNQEAQDEADLLVMNVGQFFKDVDTDLTFASKRELILWIYQSTGQSYLPIGCIKDGETCMFSRTDSDNDALDSPILRGTQENHTLDASASSITLKPEDELIVVKY